MVRTIFFFLPHRVINHILKIGIICQNLKLEGLQIQLSLYFILKKNFYLIFWGQYEK
jgi:hypothetical protein